MAKRKTKTADMLEAEVAEAVAGASYFIVSIYHDGAYRKEPVKSLEIAKQVAPLLEQTMGAKRRAMIYAVAPNGTSLMIPN